MTKAATAFKLREPDETGNSWGVRVTDPSVAVGDVVTVTTKAGDTFDRRVTRVIWSNDEIALCTAEKTESPPEASAGPPDEEPPHPAESATGPSESGCPRCRETPARRSQLWEECEHCGTEPVYV